MFFQLVQQALALVPWSSDASAHASIVPRALVAAAVGCGITLIVGRPFIRSLARHCREPNKMPTAELARLHAAKDATPTMGGLLVAGALIVTAALLADWTNPYVPITLATCLALAALGACDDWIKLATARSGLTASAKLAGQFAIAAVTAVLVLWVRGGQAEFEVSLPMAGRALLPPWLFVPWAALVIVASSNAVNLADGLDGLAGGCTVCALGALALVVFFVGDPQWAAWLHVPCTSRIGETAVLAAALAGALMGFLWFNCHPASVFLGDAGSLPLGGLLGLLSVIAGQELLLLVIGGVFVVEAASVIVQVASFRLRGKRVLRCAPLHHHFQLAGWSEDKIVVRFWIAAALCAVLGLAGLRSVGVTTDPASQASQQPQVTSLEQTTW